MTFPPISIGTRPFNSLWGIRMPPRSDPRFTAQSYAGVLAQEILEWWLRWAGVLVILAIAAALLSQVPDQRAYLALIPLLFLSALWDQIPGIQRQVELLGHTAEVVVAEEHEGLVGYGEAEAVRVKGASNYDKEFSNMTADEILSAFNRRRPLVRFLLKFVG